MGLHLCRRPHPWLCWLCHSREGGTGELGQNNWQRSLSRNYKIYTWTRVTSDDLHFFISFLLPKHKQQHIKQLNLWEVFSLALTTTLGCLSGLVGVRQCAWSQFSATTTGFSLSLWSTHLQAPSRYESVYLLHRSERWYFSLMSETCCEWMGSIMFQDFRMYRQAVGVGQHSGCLAKIKIMSGQSGVSLISWSGSMTRKACPPLCTPRPTALRKISSHEDIWRQYGTRASGPVWMLMIVTFMQMVNGQIKVVPNEVWTDPSGQASMLEVVARTRQNGTQFRATCQFGFGMRAMSQLM